MHHPTERIAHTTAFVTPVVEREIAQWRIDQMTHRTMSERSYHGATSRSLSKDAKSSPMQHKVYEIVLHEHYKESTYQL